MSSFKNRWNQKIKKDTLKILRETIKKIESGEFEVITKGTWTSGLDGKIYLRVDLKESDKLWSI